MANVETRMATPDELAKVELKIQAERIVELKKESANEYQRQALITNSPDYERIDADLCTMTKSDIDLLHASMGLVTESAEFVDTIKKTLFYGKQLDTTNLKEEIGDILWYVAIACKALDTDIATEMARNVSKLKKRYPNGFTEEKAINRDLDTERKELEK